MVCFKTGPPSQSCQRDAGRWRQGCCRASPYCKIKRVVSRLGDRQDSFTVCAILVCKMGSHTQACEGLQGGDLHAALGPLLQAARQGKFLVSLDFSLASDSCSPCNTVWMLERLGLPPNIGQMLPIVWAQQSRYIEFESCILQALEKVQLSLLQSDPWSMYGLIASMTPPTVEVQTCPQLLSTEPMWMIAAGPVTPVRRHLQLKGAGVAGQHSLGSKRTEGIRNTSTSPHRDVELSRALESLRKGFRIGRVCSVALCRVWSGANCVTRRRTVCKLQVARLPVLGAKSSGWRHQLLSA